MHPALEDAANAMGILDDVTTLQASAAESELRIAEGRDFLQRTDPESSPLDVVVVGSLGRREWRSTSTGDLDHFVVAYELPEDPTETRDLLTAIDELRSRWELEKPGPSGMFGSVVVAAPDLTERIGLEQDTNQTHSRRILILQESASLFQPERHATLLRAMVARYLADYRSEGYPEPEYPVPRFLLNDLARYWRTLTVDYQAKRWDELGRPGKWGLRYLKLVGPRKWTYAAALVPLLVCEVPLSDERAVDFFRDQFAMPPLARLAQLHDRLERAALDALRDLLLVADSFLELFNDRAARSELEKLDSRAELSDKFPDYVERGRDLQSALETLFFDSFLADKARRFLTF